MEEVQSRLLDVGSAIATPKTSQRATKSKIDRVEFSKTHVDKLEKWIDGLDEQLPPLKNFILPSGGCFFFFFGN